MFCKHTSPPSTLHFTIILVFFFEQIIPSHPFFLPSLVPSYAKFDANHVVLLDLPFLLFHSLRYDINVHYNINDKASFLKLSYFLFNYQFV